MLARFAFGVTRSAANPSHLRPHFLMPLGLVGGVIDAIGGGGWGPVTTPTLMTVGRMEPRTAIGSVSLAELMVAVAASIGFLTHLSDEAVEWSQVGALMLGAILVAPFAAWVVKILPARVLGTFVGVLIVVLNARTIMEIIGIPGPVLGGPAGPPRGGRRVGLPELGRRQGRGTAAGRRGRRAQASRGRAHGGRRCRRELADPDGGAGAGGRGRCDRRTGPLSGTAFRLNGYAASRNPTLGAS